MKKSIVFLFLLCGIIVNANVRMPLVFSDGMVLQRNKIIPVWGWADANEKVLKKRSIYACLIEGTYYDTGSKLGYLKANVDFALRDKNLSKDFRDYLKSVV